MCDETEFTSYELGKRGEEAAARYLRRSNYEILERNWKGIYGEADIIALDEDGVVCFIEVKTRSGLNAGLPEESVTTEKRRRYERIALEYLARCDFDDGTAVRFDVIGICAIEEGRALLRHHPGCFHAGS